MQKMCAKPLVTPDHQLLDGSRRTRCGFTLLQILVVVGIIAALSALLLGVINRSRTAAYRVTCDVHLKSIALALDAFKQEHGYFPASLQELKTQKYITDDSILSCPADPRPNPSYDDYYAIRGPGDKPELPIIVCPFHEDSNKSNQAFVGRYTTQFSTSPATLAGANNVTVEHPGQAPIAAPSGLVLHGADRLRTGSQGSATIEFADGSQATLSHDTDVTVLQSFVDGQGGPLYTLVHQEVGNAIYQIHKGSKFDVVTPTATAGALGTQFEVRVDKELGTYVSVSEGTVYMTSRSGGEALTSKEWVAIYPPTPAPGPDRGPPPPPKPRHNPGPPPPA